MTEERSFEHRDIEVLKPLKENGVVIPKNFNKKVENIIRKGVEPLGKSAKSN